MEQMKEFNRQEAYFSKSNPEYQNRLTALQQKYIESYNLGTAAKYFNITKERVRQLLQIGKKLKLFDYQTKEERWQYLVKTITKQQILDTITQNKSKVDVIKELKITLSEFKSLCKQYEITNAIYRQQKIFGKKQLILKGYQKIVDALGHEPTTTELSKKPYCNLWRKIDRFYGNIINFRKENNIVLNNVDLNMMHLSNHYYGIRRLLKVVDFLKTKQGIITPRMVVREGLLNSSRVYVHFGYLNKMNVISRQGKPGEYVLNHQNIYKITDDLYNTAQKIGHKPYILDKE